MRSSGMEGALDISEIAPDDRLPESDPAGHPIGQDWFGRLPRKRHPMCRAKNRSEWEDRVDAILPVAGSLVALIILLTILVV